MHIPKDSWGDGPWLNEPDEERWIDADTGLTCLALRNAITGSWCGYVGLPSEHPAHGLSYYAEPDFDPEKRPFSWNADDPITQKAVDRLMREAYRQRVAEWRAAQGRMPVQTLVNHLVAHGGLTWGAPILECDADLWFFGFDCAHAGDLMPAMDALKRQLDLPPMPSRLREQYRTLEYVRSECASLARQLADIEVTVRNVGTFHVGQS